jgi:hypothetical protein
MLHGIGRGATPLQPDVAVCSAEPSDKGRLDGGKRKPPGGASKRRREFLKELIAIDLGHREEPIREEWPVSLPSVRGEPRDPVLANPRDPDRSVGSDSPRVLTAHDSPLEPDAPIALNLNNVERCEFGDRVTRLPVGCRPHHGSRIVDACPAAGRKFGIELARAITRRSANAGNESMRRPL